MNRGGVNMSNSRQSNNQYRNDKRNAHNQGGHMNTPRGHGGRDFNQHNQNSNSNAHHHHGKKESSKDQSVRSTNNGNKQEHVTTKNTSIQKPTLEASDPKAEEVLNNNAETEMEESANEKPTEKKFTGRCRLFVGNITPDISEDEFKKLFEPYGEVSEVYVNSSRGFGFIRLDYRHNAEAAKAALDGLQRKGRVLRIRFATHGAALKVKNLHSYVSNELLEQSFSQFGDLERCVVIVDDRGKSTGEGIVEFVRKPGANSALRRISEGVFLMGVDPKPIHVEPLEQKDEEDGMPEKFLTKTDQYKKEREKEPRFAPPGTFEYEFGMRWKQLEDLEKQRIEQIKKDTEEARIKLEDEMQNALYEYQADQIRQDLLRQQEELRRLEELRNSDRQRRLQEMERRREQIDRQAEERRRADMMMNMRQQEIATRTGPLDERELRRDSMMMDRFGDRMPDRMGDRMSDRMGDRMSDRMGPGPERMGPGPERMGPGHERMGPGHERMGPGHERMGPGHERMGPGHERMGPGHERMGPGHERMGPGHERMGPGHERMGPGHERMGPGPDRMGPGHERMGPGPDRMGPNRMGPGPERMERMGHRPGMERMPDRERGMGAPQEGRDGENTGPKPLMANLPGIGEPSKDGPASKPEQGPEGQMKRKAGFEGGNREGTFQNQRGVLGNAPPGLQGPGGSPFGEAARAAAAAAAALGHIRGVPGAAQAIMQNPQAQALHERMILERRREAAREELTEIKRMRRM